MNYLQFFFKQERKTAAARYKEAALSLIGCESMPEIKAYIRVHGLFPSLMRRKGYARK
jgi:hypothetical protein